MWLPLLILYITPVTADSKLVFQTVSKASSEVAHENAE
jgi:hypothetical protein